MTQARRTVLLQNGMRLRGFDPLGQIREILTEAGDTQPGLQVNQRGTGRLVDFQDDGVSRLHVLDGGRVVVNQSIEVGATPALTGDGRFQNNAIIAFRNVANTADIEAITVTTGNVVRVGPGWPVQISGAGSSIGFFGTAPVVQGAAVANAPAGGVGTAAGGWDTAANRDAAIATINAVLARLRTPGYIAT